MRWEKIFLLAILLTPGCNRGKSHQALTQYFLERMQVIDSLDNKLKKLEKTDTGPFSAHRVHMLHAKYCEGIKREILPVIKETRDSIEKFRVKLEEKKLYIDFLNTLYEIYRLKSEFSLSMEEEKKLMKLNAVKDSLWNKIKKEGT